MGVADIEDAVDDFRGSSLSGSSTSLPLTRLPSDPNVWFLGCVTGGDGDRPDRGHEDGADGGDVDGARLAGDASQCDPDVGVAVRRVAVAG